MYCRWVRDASRPFSQGSRGGAGLAPARISQSHSYRCHSDRGYAAEPAITAVGAAKAAASGSLSWRAHDQEEHIRPTGRTPSHRALSEKNRSGLLHVGLSPLTNPPYGHPSTGALFQAGSEPTEPCL